jgi:putative ABC transport system ATP-binding protein
MSDSATSSASPVMVENVTKRFRQGRTFVEALKDVRLSIHPGEFVAVMGASGSGKSTLLHVMAGLTRPDEGRVLVDGHDLAAMSNRALTVFRRRHIGLVFQAFNLIPTLTAGDNVILSLLADGRRDTAGKRLHELLRRLEIADRLHHLPDALSGGEQQRVAIARAVITEPAILLADEPTGSLDSITGQGICRLLKELCEEQGRTVVVVTHETAVAVWSERIVVLKDGRILTEFKTSGFRDAHCLAAHYQDIVGTAPAPAAKEEDR